MRAIAMTDTEAYQGRKRPASAEAMVAALTGVQLHWQPLSTLMGKERMDGVRTQVELAGLIRTTGSSRRKRALVLNAIRCFVVQKRAGYLYIDLLPAELICLAPDELLAAIAESGLPARRLVIVLSGEAGIDRDACMQAVVALREAGITVGASLFSHGCLSLSLICMLKPQCLLLYADTSAGLTAKNIARVLVSLPAITGEPACPVIAGELNLPGCEL